MFPGLSTFSLTTPSAAPSSVTLSAWTIGVDTSTDQASYTFTATGLPGDPNQIIVVAVFGERAFAQSATINSVTGDSGAVNGTVISNSGTQRNPFAVYFLSGVTGTSSDITANFSNTQIECLIAYAVITGTNDTTYHSRSGAVPNSATATNVTSTAITIPTGGVGIAVGRVAVNNDQSWSQNSGSGSEDFDQTIGTGGVRATAYHTTSTSATTFTVTSTSASRAVCSFSWGP